MYDGPEENVTLRCGTELLDQVIDRFGEEVEIRMQDDETFEVTVPVSVSGTFYAWVFQYTGKMTIQAPEHVREAYSKMLREAADTAE